MSSVRRVGARGVLGGIGEMDRSRLGLLLVAPLALSAGCNSLSVKTFVGTIVQMTFEGSAATAPGTHLELWTRDANDGIIRVDGTYYTYTDPTTKKSTSVSPFGLMIRQAVALDDPCLIDKKGNLLTSPDAYTTKKVAGITETPDEQAQTVKNRIMQITSTSSGGTQSANLLAVTPADDTALPQIDPAASAADRLTACTMYWNSSPFAYTGNPAQVTAPVHGEVYGFVGYTTTTPPSGYDGIRIDSPTTLQGAQELWLSLESVPVANVDPVNQGPVYLEGKPDQGGNDVIHFDLTGPTASGTAALEVNLDDTSVSF
jgi:hypothetical protein